MLDAGCLVQSNSGTFNGTSGSATLGIGVAADSLVVLVTAANGVLSTPSGFVRGSASGVGSSPVAVYYRGSGQGLVAGETSWTITSGGSVTLVWAALELTGVDATIPVDVTPTLAGSTASGTSVSTGTTPLSSTYDGLVLAGHSAYQTTGGVAPTLSGHTNGLVEIVEQGGTDGTKAVGLSVSWTFTQSLSTFSSTATQSGAASAMGGNILVFNGVGARKAADVFICAGAEIGSATGLAATGNNLLYLDAATNVTVEAAAARTGSFGFRIQGTSAIANLQLSTLLIGVITQVTRFSIRFRSALPGGDLELARFGGAGGGNPYILRYRTASGKLGIQHSTGGTEELSDTVVSAAEWISLDVRLDTTTTTHTLDWRVTYSDTTSPVAQTSLSTAGQTANTANNLVIGWTGAATGNIDVDDIVMSKNVGHYPLGNMKIYPLLVDPAGTPTISGTSTNFQTFTANGTGAAWNATTARGAIDDIPPTIGASSDGVMQITAAASDYMEFPCETVDLAAVGGWIRGVRVCVAGWAASGTAATIGLFAYDGTTEYTLSAVGDPGWDNAAELWSCSMVKPLSGRIDWTPTKLDALAVRVGKSNDATPDIGIHAFVCEAVVAKAPTEAMFGVTGDVAVTAVRDTDTGGILSLTTVTPEAKPTDLHYEVNASPTDVAVAQATSHDETIQAPDRPTVNYVAIYPAAEGVADT